MNNKEVIVGEVYSATVSGVLVPVRILEPYELKLHKMWVAVNLKTNKKIQIRSSKRLLKKLTESEISDLMRVDEEY